MSTIAFYPRAVAQRLSACAEDVIISIHDAGQAPAALHPDWGDVLRLSFHDVDSAEEGFECFNAEHAQQVIEFMQKHADNPHIYVHCNMGVSRSAAVALFIAELQGRTLLQQTQRCNGAPAQYNRFVYRTLHDTYMGNTPSAFETGPM